MGRSLGAVVVVDGTGDNLRALLDHLLDERAYFVVEELLTILPREVAPLRLRGPDFGEYVVRHQVRVPDAGRACVCRGGGRIMLQPWLRQGVSMAPGP